MTLIMDDRVIVWQLNCHKSHLVHDQIGIKMQTENVTPILLLQEPSVGGSMTGFRMYRSKSGRCRSCIVAPDGLDLVFMDDLSSADTCTGILNCKGENIVVISSYMDYSEMQVDDKLIEALEYAKAKGFQALVGCDSNSQSTIWGNRKSNQRESIVLDLMVNQGLDIANIGSTPTYSRTNVESVIDLTLHTNGLNISDWKVSEADMLSDHRLITFRIDDTKSKMEAKKTRNLKKANWNKFRERLKSRFCFSTKHYWTEDDLEEESKKMTKLITEELDNVAPLRQRESKGNPLWGNPNFRMLSNKVKAARRRQDRKPTEANIAKYKQYRQELKSFKRKHEAERWQDFCENLTSPSDLSRFSKINCKRHKLGAMKEEGINYTEAADVADVLQRVHFPGSTNVDPDLPEPDKIRICDVYGSTITTPDQGEAVNEEDIQLVKELVTLEKVIVAIKSFGPYKAAGPDGLAPIVLQNLPVAIIHRYVEMFRASLLLKYLPNHWKESNVVFIPKTGRPTYDEAKAFRPITLASFQMKTMEKLLLWRIQDKSLSENPQSKYQHAFRKYYSTDTALSVVVDKAEQGLSSKQATLAVFLDIKGAFDHVDHGFIIESMKIKGIEQHVCDWYQMYLKERRSTINIGDCSRNFRSSIGVPQGGLISPTAFALCIDGYLNRLNTGGATTIAFADDVVILCSGPDIATLGNIVQSKLKVLEKWSRKSGLTFSVSKTNAMIFTKKTKYTKPKLRLCEEEIEYADKVKYLGVYLTPRLSWTAHIKEKVSACRRLLFMLLSMVRKSFQMTLKGLRWLYTMCVRPKLLYASHIWGTDLNEIQKLELQKINSLGCRFLAPCWKSTPKMTLEIIWNIMPLHILVRGTAMATFMRIKPLIRQYLKGDIGYQKGHLNNLDKFCSENEITEVIEKRVDKTFWGKEYQVNQFDDLDWITLMEDNDIRYVYTDGSMIDRLVGSGYIIRKNCEIEQVASVSLGAGRTAHQGELKAIDIALDYLLDLEIQEKTTEIRVDNQSVLSRLRSGRATTELEAKCMTKLEQLKRKTKVIFRWIRSHKGIQGNELADDLAKLGTLEDALPVSVPLPASYRKGQIDEYMYSQWKDEWKTLKGTSFHHRNSKFWLADLDPKRIGTDLLKHKRSDASLVIALVSGHNTTKEHLKRSKNLDPEDSMDCRLCGLMEETNEHLLECSELRNERVLSFGTSSKEQIKKHWKISNVVEFCNMEKVKNIIKNIE